MPRLLTHALKQQIGLPVARLLLLFVRTAPQLFKLHTCRGLKDGRARLDKRFSSSLGEGPRLPREDYLCHLVNGLYKGMKKNRSCYDPFFWEFRVCQGGVLPLLRG